MRHFLMTIFWMMVVITIMHVSGCDVMQTQTPTDSIPNPMGPPKIEPLWPADTCNGKPIPVGSPCNPLPKKPVTKKA